MPNALLKGLVPLDICDIHLVCIAWEQGTPRTEHVIIGVGRADRAAVGSAAVGVTYVLKAYVIVPSHGITGVGHRIESRLRVPLEDDHATDGRIHRDAEVPRWAVLDRVYRVVGTRVGVLVPLSVAVAVSATPLNRLVGIRGLWCHLRTLLT